MACGWLCRPDGHDGNTGTVLSSRGVGIVGATFAHAGACLENDAGHLVVVDGAVYRRDKPVVVGIAAAGCARLDKQSRSVSDSHLRRQR
jgi:hypothetical protein